MDPTRTPFSLNGLTCWLVKVAYPGQQPVYGVEDRGAGSALIVAAYESALSAAIARYLGLKATQGLDATALGDATTRQSKAAQLSAIATDAPRKYTLYDPVSGQNVTLGEVESAVLKSTLRGLAEVLGGQ